MTKPSDLLRTYKRAWFDYGSGYDTWTSEETVEAKPSEATLFGSRLRASGAHHFVVVDVDLPVEVRDSKTSGHHHLVIGKAVTWRQYKRILKALAKAGVADKDWVKATLYSREGFIAK